MAVVKDLAEELGEALDRWDSDAIVDVLLKMKDGASAGSCDAPDSCVASYTKPSRRTKAEINRIRGALYVILHGEHPMTVRQLFYRMVSGGYVGKTDVEYNSTVGRLLIQMRRNGTIPFDWIADETRWVRRPNTWSGLENVLQYTARTYRRALWDNQNSYVEVWCEKEALAGVLVDVTDPWDVPLMVTRGYPSLTYLWAAAEQMAEAKKPAFIYYLGDHDPSGRDIQRNIEKNLRGFQPHLELTFTRIAVTIKQIEELHLPTRPTKQSDSRSRNFHGGSVEVDAIEPDLLRSLVRNAIERHVDQSQYEKVLVAERSERKALELLAKQGAQR